MIFLLLLLEYYSDYDSILGTIYDLCGREKTLDNLHALSATWNTYILWVNSQYYMRAIIIVSAII